MKPAINKAVGTLLAFLLLLTFSVHQANGQEWARKMFKEYVHDFGTVQKGEVPEYRFEIENQYEEDIHIASVHSSCGCTSVSMTKNVLKTWEKGQIVCRFNSPAFDGFKQATVTVRFSRPFIGEVQLNVRGNIVRGLSMTPKSIDFGQVSEDNFPKRSIKLAHTGAASFRIVDVKSTFPHIRVQLQETGRRGANINYQMAAQLKPGTPQGFSQGELYIVVEENGVRREVPLKFSGKVVSTLQYPETITMGPVIQGQQTKKRVLLKANRPFKITDVTCHSQAFRVKADPKSKKVHFVEVIFEANEAPGRLESELNFFTDLSSTSSGTVKAIVEIKPDETAKAEVSTFQN